MTSDSAAQDAMMISDTTHCGMPLGPAPLCACVQQNSWPILGRSLGLGQHFEKQCFDNQSSSLGAHGRGLRASAVAQQACA